MYKTYYRSETLFYLKVVKNMSQYLNNTFTTPMSKQTYLKLEQYIGYTIHTQHINNIIK